MIHYVISRFNHGIYNRRRKIDTVQWNDYRIDIFERFTLPSILGQTVIPDICLLILDIRTPQNVEDYLLGLSKIIRTVRTLPPQPHRSPVRQPIIKHIKENSQEEIIVTTKLDNDDCIHKSYCQQVQTIAESVTPPYIIDITTFYRINQELTKIEVHQHSSKRQWAKNFRAAMFTIVQNINSEDFVVPYQIPHTKIGEYIPKVKYVYLPYVQVIHDLNAQTTLEDDVSKWMTKIQILNVRDKFSI